MSATKFPDYVAEVAAQLNLLTGGDVTPFPHPTRASSARFLFSTALAQAIVLTKRMILQIHVFKYRRLALRNDVYW